MIVGVDVAAVYEVKAILFGDICIADAAAPLMDCLALSDKLSPLEKIMFDILRVDTKERYETLYGADVGIF